MVLDFEVYFRLLGPTFLGRTSLWLKYVEERGVQVMVEGKRGREWRPSMSLKVTPSGLLSPSRPYLINISKPAKIAPIPGYMYMNRWG